MSTNEIINDTPRKLRVFLCHSRSDKPLVRDLYERLRADRIEAWLDEEDLVAGQDWELEILRAVRSVDVVVVCLSEGSVTKTGFIQKEIKLALDVADMQPDGTIFLIPVRLEQCKVPERLRRWQWVNLFDENGYARLVRALSARLKQIVGSPSMISKLEQSKPSFETLKQEIIEAPPKQLQLDSHSDLAESPLTTENDLHYKLLKRWNNGDKEARDELFTREYSQLRLIAKMRIQGEWEIDGLQTEEVLSELYIKLVSLESIKWQNREHFLGVASRLIRHILIDWARRKYTNKRGGPIRLEDEREAKKIVSFNREDLTNLEEALRILEKVAPRPAQIVDLRIFGGLTITEISESLEISPSTIEREWRLARAWLAVQLK